MTEVAINRLRYWQSRWIPEQALRADAGNMLLKTYQRRLPPITNNDEGQGRAGAGASAPGWK